MRVFVLPLFLIVADFSEAAGPQSVAGETRVGGRVVNSHSVRRHSRVGDGRRSSAPDLYKSSRTLHSYRPTTICRCKVLDFCVGPLSNQFEYFSITCIAEENGDVTVIVFITEATRKCVNTLNKL